MLRMHGQATRVRVLLQAETLQEVYADDEPCREGLHEMQKPPCQSNAWR